MKMPFISRKKYEIARANYRVAMEGQTDLKKKYIECQESLNSLRNEASKLCEKVEVDDYVIKDLKKEIKRLKTLLTQNGIVYKREAK